jgi:hypothetical protein
MGNAPADSVAELDERWRERRARWSRKLGRLRLGVEPLDAQLARHRRVAWAISAVAGGMAAFFTALFWAFGRPDIGLIVAAIFPGLTVATFWIGHLRLARRARAFEREYEDYRAERERRAASTASRTTESP